MTSVYKYPLGPQKNPVPSKKLAVSIKTLSSLLPKTYFLLSPFDLKNNNNKKRRLPISLVLSHHLISLFMASHSQEHEPPRAKNPMARPLTSFLQSFLSEQSDELRQKIHQQVDSLIDKLTAELTSKLADRLAESEDLLVRIFSRAGRGGHPSFSSSLVNGKPSFALPSTTTFLRSRGAAAVVGTFSTSSSSSSPHHPNREDKLVFSTNNSNSSNIFAEPYQHARGIDARTAQEVFSALQPSAYTTVISSSSNSHNTHTHHHHLTHQDRKRL